MRATIEELGQALGALIEQTGAPQVDVVGFNMGSLTVRAYLSGKQNAPGVFQPPDEHKIRKAVFLGGLFFGVGNGASPAGSGHCDPVPDPQDDALCIGSRFLWDLATWNRGGDDLRGIDAIALAGSGQETVVGSRSSDGDGVVSVSSASLSFAYPAERTRIVTACHVEEVCMPTVSFVDSDSHPAWLMIESFLAGTDDWKSVGSSSGQNAVQSTNGGILVGVKDGSDNLVDATQVSLSGRALDRSFETGLGLFYGGQVAKGDYILQAAAGIPVPDVPFSPKPGTYSIMTMKPGPFISSVVIADGEMEVRGTRLAFGGTGRTQLLVNDQPIPVQSVSDVRITSPFLPAVTGFLRLKVITMEGSHAFNTFLEANSGPPRIAPSGVMNAASYISGAVAPGEFVVIAGTGLGPANPVTAAGYEKGLGGTKVTFNGIEAFLRYSSATQVNALVPYGVTGKAEMTIAYNGRRSDLFPLAVADSAPGIFTGSYGPGQASALNDDGTFNSPENEVARGGWIVFWATGQGLVDPFGQDGEILTAPKKVNLPVTVLIDGIEAPLLHALLTYTGVVQIGARVPSNSRTGSVPLVLNIGGASSRKDVTVSVK